MIVSRRCIKYSLFLLLAYSICTTIFLPYTSFLFPNSDAPPSTAKSASFINGSHMNSTISAESLSVISTKMHQFLIPTQRISSIQYQSTPPKSANSFLPINVQATASECMALINQDKNAIRRAINGSYHGIFLFTLYSVCINIRA